MIHGAASVDAYGGVFTVNNLESGFVDCNPVDRFPLKRYHGMGGVPYQHHPGGKSQINLLCPAVSSVASHHQFCFFRQRRIDPGQILIEVLP